MGTMTVLLGIGIAALASAAILAKRAVLHHREDEPWDDPFEDGPDGAGVPVASGGPPRRSAGDAKPWPLEDDS